MAKRGWQRLVQVVDMQICTEGLADLIILTVENSCG